MPRSLCEGISFLQNRLSREGVEYEVANGAHIPNLGERRCEMMTIGSSTRKSIIFRVADVHKPLLSISGCAAMGSDCDLCDKGRHLLDKQSGEKISLERREQIYRMRAWIRQDPGTNMSQPFCQAELARMQRGKSVRLLTSFTKGGSRSSASGGPEVGGAEVMASEKGVIEERSEEARRTRVTKRFRMPTTAGYDCHMTLYADCVAGRGSSL